MKDVEQSLLTLHKFTANYLSPPDIYIDPKNSYYPMTKKPFSIRKRASVYIKKLLCQFVYIDSQLRFQVASFVFMDNVAFSQFVQHSTDFW